MDSDKPSPSPRKPRFAPKAPTKRKTRAVAKKEKADENDDAEAQKQLLQRFNQLGSLRQRSKVEDKAPVQPTFIHGTKQSVTNRGSGIFQDGGLKQNRELDFMDLDDSTKQFVSPLSADGPSVIKKSSGEDSGPKTKDYREPWNYAHSYYPTTLPWRRPYSGDPDMLDEAEFGEAAMKLEYDERSISPASELGFLVNPDETNENVRLLFLQFPPSLPHIKRSATAKGKEIEDKSGAKESTTAGISQRSCSLEELSAGQMGKLLVYKSGAVKLKLGETLYDVSPGSDCSFSQDVVALNIKEKECCSIGNLDKRAIMTPDTEYLLNSVIDLG